MPKQVRQRDEAKSVVFVRDAVLDFLASVEVKRLAASTREEYQRNLTQFAEWCAHTCLVQNKKDSTWSVQKPREKYDSICLHRVNAQAVHFFLEHIRATSKPSKADNEELSGWTLVQYVKDIKRFLNWCLMDEQYCEHVQAITIQRIQMPKVEQQVIEVFTEADIEALFKACEKEESDHLRTRDKAIVSLLLYSGIRVSEMCSLTIGNVDLSTSDPHIKILGKGKKWGEVGFKEDTRRALQRYIRQFREPTIEYQIEDQLRKLSPRQAQQLKRESLQGGRVFVGRTGKPLTRNGVLQLVNRLGEWAGVEGVRCSPHTFRHTFACLFMRNGGDIYQLSQLLRHSSVKTTEIYLRALRQAEARRGAKSVLDSL